MNAERGIRQPNTPTKVTWRAGRFLAVVLAIIAIGSCISGFFINTDAAVRSIPVHALVLWVAWAMFWNPHVEVCDDEVTIVNTLRSYRIPMNVIDEVSTRWGLIVSVGGRKYQAWAAPAPGTLHTMRVNPKNFTHLPDSTFEVGTARLSDDPETDSGAAAVHIRRGLENAQPGNAESGVRTRWHVASLALGAVCLAATLVTVL